MKSDSLSRRAHVILGATCYADAEASLRVAVVLARQIGGEIHGCLVTDEAILASVAHPRARAVAYSGQSLTKVTSKSMHAAFRADAKLFEDQLLRTARQASLGTVFSEARGRFASVLHEKAVAGDLIVFGFRRAIRDGDRIVLVLGDDQPESGILSLGVQLSAALRKRLTLFAAPELTPEITSRLSKLAAPTYDLRPYIGNEALLSELDRMSPSAVVVGFRSSGIPSVMRLVNAARCPVVFPVTRSTMTAQETGPAPA